MTDLTGYPRGRSRLVAGGLVLSLILLASPFIVASATILSAGVPDYPSGGDTALLEISTRRAALGEMLTGPYSRLGFSHPGPVYFFLRIPLYYLFDLASSSSILTVSILGTLSLIGAVLIMRRHGSDTIVFVSCLVMALLLAAIRPDIYLDDWNPFVVMLPMLFLTLAIASVCAGDPRWLPSSVLAGSFAVQTHLGCLPTVVGMGVAAIPSMRAGMKSNGPEGWHRSMLLSVLAGLALWLPVVFQQITGAHGGNISAIAGFLMGSRPDPLSLDTMRDWSASLSELELLPLPPGALRMGDNRVLVLAAVTLVRISLLVVSLRVARRDPRDRFLESLCLLGLLAHVTTLLSVLQVREGLQQYLIVWFAYVAPVSWIAIAGTFIRARRLDRPGGLATALLVALVAVPSIPNLLSVTRVLDTPDLDARVPGLSGLISARIGRDDAGTTVIVLGDHDLWPLMAGVVNDLQKLGVRVDVDPSLGFFPDMAPASFPATLLLTSDSLWVPGYSEFARYGGVRLGSPCVVPPTPVAELPSR